MMPETQPLLLSLARDSRAAAELLREAICHSCHSCVSEISDLNRHTLFELSEEEKRQLSKPSSQSILPAIHALGECVTKAFSAAMLITNELPPLPPLADIVTCNAELACYAEKLLTRDAVQLQPYSLHLCANKARGAHALLLTNCFSDRTAHRLLPLALTLESHRNSLERACGILMEVI